MGRHKLIALGVAFAVLAVAVMALAFMLADRDIVDVSLTQPGDAETTRTVSEEPLTIAVSAMTSPKNTFEYYESILNYISEKMGRPVELVQRETYEEVNDLLEEGDLDAAFVCTGAYVAGHDDFGMEILVAPVAYGAPEYFSYIIVSKSSEAETLEDLRGTVFAFTDPMSNTGTLVPTYMLGQIGETPDSFFEEYVYTYSHDRSIEAVADGITDAAAVDSLIYDYMAATGEVVIDETRVLVKSPPYGIPPVVVHPDLDQGTKAELREVLTGMHLDPEGRAILAHVKIDRFTVVSDSAYDSVREMQAWIDENAPRQQ